MLRFINLLLPSGREIFFGAPELSEEEWQRIPEWLNMAHDGFVLPNTVCTPTDCGLPASDDLSTPAAISG